MKHYNNNKKTLIRMRLRRQARILFTTLVITCIASIGAALCAVNNAKVPEPKNVTTEATSTESITEPTEEVTSCPSTTTAVLMTSLTTSTTTTTTTTQPLTSTSTTTHTTTTTSTTTLTTTAIEMTEPATEAPVITNGYSESEAVMLAQLIHLEASATWNGKVYVGSVVINRMKYFDDSMSEIIFAPRQFTTASRLRNYTEADYEAATYVLSNGSVDSRVFYFDGNHSDGLNHFYDINHNYITAQ